MTIWAGPIVRRVTPTEVYLWFATDRRPEIKALLYTTVLDPSAARWKLAAPVGVSVADGKATTRTVQLGSRLWVSLAKLVPIPKGTTFPTQVPLAYQVQIDGSLLDLSSLAYREGGHDTPTIVLPADGVIHALHGSCRKMHGGGDDAMYAADLVVQATAQAELEIAVKRASSGGSVDPGPSRRSPSLFLTGDQIYADDVSPFLAGSIQAIGIELMGQAEQIPFPSPARPRVPISEIDPGERSQLLNGVFSSTAMDDHLVTFGEFAATYLLMWGDALWTRVKIAPPRQPVHLFDIPVVTERSDTNKARTEQASVARFRKRLPSARRLLANHACYMLLDDHEITDDWNITPQWFVRTRAFPLARLVFRNALSAYAVFQFWGNQPDAIDDTLLGAIGARARDVAKADGRHAKVEQQLDASDWSFVTPGTPGVVFLDTRTHRDLTSSPGAPAGLLAADALARAIVAIERVAKDREIAVFVSPVPLVGLPTIDGAQLRSYLASGGPTSVDFESWIANARTIHTFKRELYKRLRGKTLLVLSGDVHFSYAAQETFAKSLGTGSDGLKFVQFTSSALKNNSFPDDVKAPNVFDVDYALSLAMGIPGQRTVYFGPEPAEGTTEADPNQVRPSTVESRDRLLMIGPPIALLRRRLSALESLFSETVTWLGADGRPLCFFRHSTIAELYVTRDKYRGRFLRLALDATKPIIVPFGDAIAGAPF